MIEKEATFGTWLYYVNDEGKARWKCSECGKIVHRFPAAIQLFSRCGARLMTGR